jgi:hypothetical protein
MESYWDEFAKELYSVKPDLFKDGEVKVRAHSECWAYVRDNLQ